jgi:aldehyde dehydrogenase (NAD+)
MMATPEHIILDHFESQKAFFGTNATKDVGFRLTQLKKLKSAILKYQPKIEDALWADLHKSKEEAFMTEIALVLGELNHHISHLKKWAKPKRVKTPFHLLPSQSKVIFEPLGVALVVAPWNYPFQLLFNSLIGAMSSGCCCILKTSPDTLTVAKVMENLIAETFEPNYITLVQGEKETNTVLFNLKFDITFFTGSPKVGKVVMAAAANNLTSVVLELGGKSPCIVDQDAKIKVAAKRIIWGKLINAGQTCIAPDYLFVHESVKDQLITEMVEVIKAMHGNNIKESRFYPRIVNERAINRLEVLLEQGNIVFGGEVDKAQKYLSPTIIDNIQHDYKIMQDEIFGPILPVLIFKDIKEPIDYINKNQKPLAFYYFGKNENAKNVLAQTTSGGVCINDTLMQISNHNLPFGGVGNSGLGKYHGYDSFLAFSNRRGVVKTPTWIDLPFKYPPFKYFNFVRKIM